MGPFFLSYVRVAAMTNPIALVLASIIVIGLILDMALNSGAAFLFLARKFAQFIEWLAFWR